MRSQSLLPFLALGHVVRAAAVGGPGGAGVRSPGSVAVSDAGDAVAAISPVPELGLLDSRQAVSGRGDVAVRDPGDVAASGPGDAVTALSPAPEFGLLDSRQAMGGIFRKIWRKIKTAASCFACAAVVALLKGATLLGDKIFVKISKILCKFIKITDRDVCEGTIILEAPALAKNLRRMAIGSSPARALCATMIGLCKYPTPKRWNVPFDALPSPAPVRPQPKGRPPLKVVHYSDIHVDPLYEAGASTECNKPICCRAYTDGDRPGRSHSPAGPFGDHNCDVPFALEESMYRAVRELVPDAAFGIFTGDIIDHALWNTSRPYNERMIEHAYSVMNNSSLPLVYGTAGNHEMHPTNLYQPTDRGRDSQWVYNILSHEWKPWIGSAAADSARKLGAYSTRFPGGNLRIISLNTNMYYRFNFWMYGSYYVRDPNNQIAWLVSELTAAERAGENVYIIGHLAPGDVDTLHPWSNYLDQVFKRFSATIAAMFFGHTHMDQFEISYSDYRERNASNAFLVSYIASSLTPTAGMPSFRVYDVDPDTFGVLDVTTYMADMKDPGFQTAPKWTKYYSAKEAYGAAARPRITDKAAELTPAFWHSVTEAMELDDALFDYYMARKKRGWRARASCRDRCKEEELCQLRAGRAQDNCFKPRPGLRFDKRDGAAGGEHDDCGTPLIADALADLPQNDEMLRSFVELLEEETERARAEGSPEVATAVMAMLAEGVDGADRAEGGEGGDDGGEGGDEGDEAE